MAPPRKCYRWCLRFAQLSAKRVALTDVLFIINLQQQQEGDMDRELHPLTIRLNAYNSHKDEALFTSLNNLSILMEKAQHVTSHLQNQIHQRGMRIARLMSRIQECNDRVEMLSVSGQGLQMTSPIDYPDVVLPSSSLSEPIPPNIPADATEEQEKAIEKKFEENLSSSYNFISAFLPSYAQNPESANAFDQLSKSLNNVACKLKSNESDLNYFTNKVNLTERSIAEIGQLVQQRYIKRTPFTDNKKFVLDCQRPTHVVNLTKQGIGKKPHNVSKFCDIYMFGSAINVYDSSHQDAAKLQKLIEIQKRKQKKNKSRVTQLEETLISRDLKNLGNVSSKRGHIFRPGENETRPELKVSREFVLSSNKTQILIDDQERRQSLVVEESEMDSIIPKYEETEMQDEEEETEEEKMRRLDELQNAREDILEFVNEKQKEKKNLEQTYQGAEDEGEQTYEDTAETIQEEEGDDEAEEEAKDEQETNSAIPTSAIPTPPPPPPPADNANSAPTPPPVSSVPARKPAPPKRTKQPARAQTRAAPSPQKPRAPPKQPARAQTQAVQSAIPSGPSVSAIPQIGGGAALPPPPPPPPPLALDLPPPPKSNLTLQDQIAQRGNNPKLARQNSVPSKGAKPVGRINPLSRGMPKSKTQAPKPAQRAQPKGTQNAVPTPKGAAPSGLPVPPPPPPMDSILPPPPPPPPPPAPVATAKPVTQQTATSKTSQPQVKAPSRPQSQMSMKHAPSKPQSKAPSLAPSTHSSRAPSISGPDAQEDLPPPPPPPPAPSLSIAAQAAAARSKKMNQFQQARTQLKEEHKKKEKQEQNNQLGRRKTAIENLVEVINIRAGRIGSDSEIDEKSSGEESDEEYD